MRTRSSKCSSTLAHWIVVEIFDNEVPKKVLKTLEAEQARTSGAYTKDRRGAVYSLMWQDLLFYHGEDGWCIDDETLAIVEPWLDKQSKHHDLEERSPFWFRIKRA